MQRPWGIHSDQSRVMSEHEGDGGGRQRVDLQAWQSCDVRSGFCSEAMGSYGKV